MFNNAHKFVIRKKIIEGDKLPMINLNTIRFAINKCLDQSYIPAKVEYEVIVWMEYRHAKDRPPPQPSVEWISEDGYLDPGFLSATLRNLWLSVCNDYFNDQNYSYDTRLTDYALKEGFIDIDVKEDKPVIE